MADDKHTILLVQPSSHESRQYSDYDSLNEALEGVCHMYEIHLKKSRPKDSEISYDLSQLFEFIDELTDVSVLVFQRTTHSYAPYDKEWVKEKLYIMLRQENESEVVKENGITADQPMDLIIN